MVVGLDLYGDVARVFICYFICYRYSLNRFYSRSTSFGGLGWLEHGIGNKNGFGLFGDFWPIRSSRLNSGLHSCILGFISVLIWVLISVLIYMCATLGNKICVAFTNYPCSYPGWSCILLFSIYTTILKSHNLYGLF